MSLEQVNVSNSSTIENRLLDFYTFIESLRTLPDLSLWIYIVFSIFFGILLNLLVLFSAIRIKFNGKSYIKKRKIKKYFLQYNAI